MNTNNNVNSSSYTSNESLYPDILFHFTSKEGLYGILEDSFRLSYAREQIAGPKHCREFAVPIVSFCDLRLSELKNHMEKYGKYDLGLTKEWANRKGLSPVMYVNRHCQFADRFNSAIDSIYRYLGKIHDQNQNKKRLHTNYMNILDTYRYLKNYEGNLERKESGTIPDYRFADEREWRYVLPWETEGIQPFVAKSNINTKQKKDDHNKKLESIRLEFDIDDVKYLIVDNESDITDLIEHITTSTKKKGKVNDGNNSLISKILTSNQIKRDM